MSRRAARPETLEEADSRVTLHPLDFEEALEALLATPPPDEEKDGEDLG